MHSDSIKITPEEQNLTSGEPDQNVVLLYEDNRSSSKGVKPVNYSVMLPSDNSLFASERKSFVPTDGDTN